MRGDDVREVPQGGVGVEGFGGEHVEGRAAEVALLKRANQRRFVDHAVVGSVIRRAADFRARTAVRAGQ